MEGGGCRVEGGGLRVEAVGCWVWGLIRLCCAFTSRSASLRVQGLGFKIYIVGFRVQGLGCKMYGAG